MPEQIFGAGQIVREFKVTCAVCKQSHRAEAENIDKFAKNIEGQWRLSRELGWTHSSCCKLMPNQIKFNATQDSESDPAEA